jgi:NaMN:DMB phosphoribosyltransferase
MPDKCDFGSQLACVDQYMDTNQRIIFRFRNDFGANITIVNASGEIIHLQLHEELSEGILLVSLNQTEAIFQKGVAFGREYECENDYIILGESVPSGTTTANTTALALGYDAKEFFSSSFKNVPNSVREETIKKALENIKDRDDLFDILGSVADNMLIFNAGFILGLNNRIKIILAGGTQMAGVLLIVNSILKYMGGKIESSNLALCTTKWVAQDKNSDIKALLNILDFPINSYFVDFDFTLSQHPALKLYDEGEAKEGVGAGGALAYGILNGLDKKTITNKIETFLS